MTTPADVELSPRPEGGPHRCVAPLRIRGHVAVDVHARSAHSAGDLGHDLDGVTGAHEQSSTLCPQARVQRAEVGQEQVPAAGACRDEHGGIEDEEGEDVVSGLRGSGTAPASNTANLMLDEPQFRTRMCVFMAFLTAGWTGTGGPAGRRWHTS